MVKYISTRGNAPELNFEQVVLAGLANDGGLYVPNELPHFSSDELQEMAQLNYADLCFKVVQPFIGDAIPEGELRAIIQETYDGFFHDAVAPLSELGEQQWILELYHGPTLAFKDFALQLLGRILNYILQKHNEQVVILGATSGDTGSAALEGCRHCHNVDMFILHPYNRISEVQRRQMTTIQADNVHNLALEGNFDDCQEIVKNCFQDKRFLNGRSLVAVNSINWARIMAQIVYYFYAGLKLGAPEKSMAFSVPTGNFGDIYAGFIAKKMGLPIHQLVIATNSNDILHRFLSQNQYDRAGLHHTLSPSMDIQVSSNFERLLFDLYDHDAEAVANLMADFKETGKMSIDDACLAKARELFDSLAVDDQETLTVIKQVHEQTGQVVDPHTAIGVKAAWECVRDPSQPMVVLSTAHPAKFPDAVVEAGLEKPGLPEHLSDLFEREESMQVVKNDLEEVKHVILQNLGEAPASVSA